MNNESVEVKVLDFDRSEQNFNLTDAIENSRHQTKTEDQMTSKSEYVYMFSYS